MQLLTNKERVIKLNIAKMQAGGARACQLKNPLRTGAHILSAYCSNIKLNFSPHSSVKERKKQIKKSHMYSVI